MSYLIFLVLFDLHYDDHLTATGLTSIQVPCHAATAASSSPPAPDPAPGGVFVVIVEGQRSLGLPFVSGLPGDPGKPAHLHGCIHKN